MTPVRTICFGPFELDVRSAELRKHGTRIRLHEQPFRILVMLLDRRGAVVLRDEIRLALWPNDTVVEFDHGINAAIQRLRTALGDSAGNPRYIETLARRGYRFIGSVEGEQLQPEVEPAADTEAKPSATPAVEPLDLSGRTLAHFRIMGKLGSGGMGVVYRAEDLKLGREVALKFLPIPAGEAVPAILERFRREARAASALNHPHICTIYGLEELAGQPVIEMELLEGETLEQRLLRGPMTAEQAMPLTRQLADALNAAHRKGVVHRDLKPANVMLTLNGIKVLDFGLARLERADTRSDETATEVTQVGTILGTWRYMSPEQAQGRDADARSDIFSFGCVLLEMLTGRPAFSGDTPADLIGEILIKDPLAGVELPPALLGILRHCLEKSPEDRFQTARDLAFALDPTSGISTSGGPPTPTLPAAARSRDIPRLAAAAAAVLACALVFWTGTKIGERRRQPTPNFRQLSFRRGTVFSARFAPDGHSVVFGAAWDGKPIRVFSTRPDSPESRPLGVPDADVLSISASGELALSLGRRPAGGGAWLAFGTLARAPLAGGAPREILENVESAAWSPDGRLAVIRATTGTFRLEYPIGKSLCETQGAFTDPRVSPKGDRIALLEHPIIGDDVGSVAVVDLEGHKRVLTGQFDGGVQGLAWSPAGDEIWFSASKSGTNFDLYAVKARGGTEPRIVARTGSRLKLHDISGDGRVLASIDHVRSGIVASVPHETAEHDMSWLDFSKVSGLSADGETMLFAELGVGGGDPYSVYIRKTDGSEAVRLGEGRALGLSPDGKWVATTSIRAGQSDLTLLPTGPGDSRNLLPDSPRTVDHAAWFPDSRRIAYDASESGHRHRVFVLDINGGAPRPVTPEGWHLAGRCASPDGRSLIVRDDEARPSILSLASGDRRPLEGFRGWYHRFFWSLDGRSLLVSGAAGVRAEVRRVDLASGRSQTVRNLAISDPAGIISMDPVVVTPDGKYYAYSFMRVLSDLFLIEGLK